MLTDSSFEVHRRPDVLLFAKEIRPAIETWVQKHMKPRARTIMRQRLDGQTLESIGDENGICKERVRDVVVQEIRHMQPFIQLCFGNWYLHHRYGFAVSDLDDEKEYEAAFVAVLAEVL